MHRGNPFIATFLAANDICSVWKAPNLPRSLSFFMRAKQLTHPLAEQCRSVTQPQHQRVCVSHQLAPHGAKISLREPEPRGFKAASGVGAVLKLMEGNGQCVRGVAFYPNCCKKSLVALCSNRGAAHFVNVNVAQSQGDLARHATAQRVTVDLDNRHHKRARRCGKGLVGLFGLFNGK